MSSTDKVAVELRHEGRLLHLTLNAPKANIIDAEMMGGIVDAVNEHGPNPEVRAIAFEGAGKHFSFGASVEEHQADQVAEMLAGFHRMFRTLLELSVPTIAIVRGQCLGGGMELASYCSWIFAADKAYFGQPEIKLAVFPPLASVLLPWRIGGGAALDLCVSGRSITAAEAHRIGLVTDVSPDPSAAAEAFFGENLASLSGSSVRFAERAVRSSLRPLLQDQLAQVERMYIDELMATPDANNGIAAFLNKGK